MKSRPSNPIINDFAPVAGCSQCSLIAGWLLIFLLLAAPVSLLAQNFSYTVYNGTVTITGYSGPGGAVVIPDTITNFPVVSIAQDAFLTNATLDSVTISSNVLSIGDDAFEGCYNLTNATIPPHVASIGDFAFSDTGLASVTIPSTVTSLGNGVFDGCSSLGAINVAGGNASYSSVGGVLFDHVKATLIQCPPGVSGSFTIPNTVTAIDAEAFSGCVNLTSITIPNTVTSIGDFAFNNTGLTNVTIPTGLTSIGSHVFAFCASLTSVTIPNGVKSIGPEAFVFDTSLTNATIGSGVTSLGSYAFGFCTSLATVYFNGNAPSADATVFSGDSSLAIFVAGNAASWGTSFEGIPIGNPVLQLQGANLGFNAGQFSFNIVGYGNPVIVVQACTNLANPSWISLQTNSLNNGTAYFNDPLAANYPRRFYRVIQQ